MNGFLQALKEQRWDDHRYYHHSRVNQSLNFVSALSFVCAYVLLFTHPVAAGLLGWVVAMVTRQAGHFFFEPKDFDVVNQATHKYKEQVKVGYNLRRKVVLMSLWAVSPLALYIDPVATDLHTSLNTSETALHSLDAAQLCPGAKMLDKINASFR